jgi:hypothetical protein
VGPGNAIAGTESWLEACETAVLNDGSQPFLAPGFPGFNSDAPFRCRLIYGDPLRVEVTESSLKRVLEGQPNFYARIQEVARLYGASVETLAQRDPRPDVAICALPQGVIDLCTTTKTKAGEVKRRKTSKDERKARKSIEAGQGVLFPELDPTATLDDEEWHFSDLRRAIKVLAMQCGMPTQLAWPRAIALVDTEDADAQDRATRAWNFMTGIYYKAGGTPWRLGRAPSNTCFVGISFYRELNQPRSKVRTAMAQMFTSSGDGYVLRGNTFEWDADRSHSHSPHLDRESAASLMQQVISLYRRQNRDAQPGRVVLHKSSRFWEGELEGFMQGCSGVPRVDLVSLQWRGVQFYRTGLYPPLRGTFVRFSEQDQLLYTMGYVPIQRSYNGPRVPQPLEVVEHIGDTPWRDILEEILGLTKLNWNTAAFACSEPMTLALARRVGRILAEVGPEGRVREEYRFYM